MTRAEEAAVLLTRLKAAGRPVWTDGEAVWFFRQGRPDREEQRQLRRLLPEVLALLRARAARSASCPPPAPPA